MITVGILKYCPDEIPAFCNPEIKKSTLIVQHSTKAVWKAF